MPLPKPANLAKPFADFRKDQDGSITVLTLFLIIAMIFTAGIAVDMMRFETYRARLQSTVDRATLAAADLHVCLDDSIDKEALIADYFEKNGFASQLTSISIQSDDNSCAVEVDAQIDVNTIFMKLIGFGEVNTGPQDLTAVVTSAATEAISDVEISLVLDISGSMGWNGKIEQLRTAAGDFVDDVNETVEDGRLSISIVPYASQVNLGPALIAQYPRAYAHGYSHCLELPANSYSSTAIPQANNIPQAAHFDPYNGAAYNDFRPAVNFICNPEEYAQVVPISADMQVLHDSIDNLEANGATSIEIGAKWGVALLDPSSRGDIQGLINLGVVDNEFSDRPADFGNDDTMKVLVIMTDGENTPEYSISTNRRSQDSDVWLNSLGASQDGHCDWSLSLGDADCDWRTPFRQQYDNLNHLYYVRDREPGDRDADGNAYEDYYIVEHDSNPNIGPEDAWVDNRLGTRLTWQDIWANYSLRTHAWNFRGDQTDDFGVYNQWYNNLVTVTYGAAKDDRLDRICTAAKDAGIIVYTIGFEVSDRSAGVMHSCASDDNTFFRVENGNLENAFAAIASDISALRLYQ